MFNKTSWSKFLLKSYVSRVKKGQAQFLVRLDKSYKPTPLHPRKVLPGGEKNFTWKSRGPDTMMNNDFESELVDALKDVVKGSNWILIGAAEKFRKNICTRLYAEDGEDVVLIYAKETEKFHAMDAICSHEGGPLEQGDIEDLDGRLKIICPWHCYDFDLETGISSSGLKQEVYEVKVEEGNVYIYKGEELSLKPFNKSAVTANTDGNTVEQTETIPESHNKGTLAYWAVKILNTPDPHEKAKLTQEIGERLKHGEITEIGKCHPPDVPLRDQNLNQVKPGKEKRRGKGGSLSSRISNIHSVCNIEQWAVDLSWDILVRFSDFMIPGTEDRLPKEFFDDFVKVACDEARHFKLASDRLEELGSYFGALPVHDSLWQSATVTRESLLARLAIVHMVHEARGLDVQPKTLEKFAKNNDPETVKILEVIYQDEITHVAAGLKWFSFICRHSHPPMDSITTFHKYVKEYFIGYIKPPFNTEGRIAAGMTEEWYMPLTKPKN